jgi:hypothetical protein
MVEGSLRMNQTSLLDETNAAGLCNLEIRHRDRLPWKRVSL